MWDDWVVIVTSDHGEEFDDNHLGYWRHTSNYTKYQLKVPFLIHWPGITPKTFQHKTTHYDVAPTLIEDFLSCRHFQPANALGHNLFSTQKRDYIIAGSYVDNAVVTNDRIYILPSTGTFETQSLDGKVIAHRFLDKALLHQALQHMRQYYTSDDSK